MACITSVSLTIHLNGQKSPSFKGNRGLKQGDPLSPLLFVFSIEYLSRLLHRNSMHKGFKFHPNYNKLRLNHLMFTNDLILFCKADTVSLKLTMNALQCFHSTSGYKANMAKSQVVFEGCSEHLKVQCLEVTGFQEGKLPLKYLGVPVTASKLSKLDYSMLVDKILTKVKIWSSRNISFTDRTVSLIQLYLG